MCLDYIHPILYFGLVELYEYVVVGKLACAYLVFEEVLVKVVDEVAEFCVLSPIGSC